MPPPLALLEESLSTALPGSSFVSALSPAASNEAPSLPPSVTSPASAVVRSVVFCGSVIGPPFVLGAYAGLPTTAPVKTRFTQWSSVEMYTR